MISPDSFFFAGEPGGYLGMKIDTARPPEGHERTAGRRRAASATRSGARISTMHWTRMPTEGSEAKLGSRQARARAPATRRAQPESSSRSTASIQGREARPRHHRPRHARQSARSDTDCKPAELPANWVTTLWLADGVGLVQSLNSYAHMYQLDRGDAEVRLRHVRAAGASPSRCATASAPAIRGSTTARSPPPQGRAPAISSRSSTSAARSRPRSPIRPRRSRARVLDLDPERACDGALGRARAPRRRRRGASRDPLLVGCTGRRARPRRGRRLPGPRDRRRTPTPRWSCSTVPPRPRSGARASTTCSPASSAAASRSRTSWLRGERARAQRTARRCAAIRRRRS